MTGETEKQRGIFFKTPSQRLRTQSVFLEAGEILDPSDQHSHTLTNGARTGAVGPACP